MLYSVLLHVDFAKFLGDLSRWTIPLQGITWRPPQELIDVGLLDTTGWVDLAIPTKNNIGFLGPQMLPKCPPSRTPAGFYMLHALLWSHATGRPRRSPRFCYSSHYASESQRNDIFCTHGQEKTYVLDKIPETDVAPEKLVVRRLVSFWEGISSGATLVYRNALPITKVEIS